MPVVKNLPDNAGDIRDVGLISGSEWSLGGGNNTPLQYCWKNPMDRGAWWATVFEVSESQTQLSVWPQAQEEGRVIRTILKKFVIVF